MPFAELRDVRIHYDLAGPATAPALVFSNSLGANLSMWDGQLADFSSNLRVLRYDARGHGASSVPPGPYNFDHLGNDVLGLLNALDIDRVFFCGLSMGGMTGQWLGVHAPERVIKLVLCSTGAKIGNADTWNARIDTVRRLGMNSISTGVIERWFTAMFREQSPGVVQQTKRMIEETDVEGYAACCGALRDSDLRASLAAIRTPTLVISGTHDPATPPADGQFLAKNIPGARYVELDAAHLLNIEQRDCFTAQVRSFLCA